MKGKICLSTQPKSGRFIILLATSMNCIYQSNESVTQVALFWDHGSRKEFFQCGQQWIVPSGDKKNCF